MLGHSKPQVLFDRRVDVDKRYLGESRRASQPFVSASVVQMVSMHFSVIAKRSGTSVMTISTPIVTSFFASDTELMV